MKTSMDACGADTVSVSSSTYDKAKQLQTFTSSDTFDFRTSSHYKISDGRELPEAEYYAHLVDRHLPDGERSEWVPPVRDQRSQKSVVSLGPTLQVSSLDTNPNGKSVGFRTSAADSVYTVDSEGRSFKKAKETLLE